MHLYPALTILIAVCAAFSYINHRMLRLPPTIGIMLLSMGTSAAVLFAGHFFPDISRQIILLVQAIDFKVLLLDIMLPLLLFAGAIQINIGELRKRLVPIIILASVGTMMSAALVGGLMYGLFYACGINIDFIICLLFGALISPTDPVAVLGMLKRARIGPALELKIAGESLFNDGVGVVIFITLLEIATAGVSSMNGGEIALLFAREAIGGLLYGAALGYAGAWLLRSIDNYQTEVLITLALVMGGYAAAGTLHVSGPLAIVVAGIIIGNKSGEDASDITRDYLDKFWHLIDELLNAVLFLLVGFELLLLHASGIVLLIGCCAVVVVLIARLISVALPVAVLRRFKVPFERNVVLLLTWAGLRGGLSLAMALSLPAALHRDELVTVTYCVVVFSIIVQGLTVGKLAGWLRRRAD